MIRLASVEDVPALVPVLARAFVDDPFVAWLVRRDAKRDAGFARFFELALRVLTLPHGEVYTTDALDGAALWVPPDRWKTSFVREMLLVHHWTAICGVSRLLRVQLATTPLVKAHPREPHYYLFILGVDPASQGRGIGRSLVAPILARCDRERMPAYLETGTEANVRLYRSLGFEVTGEVTLKDGPRLWLMWRPVVSR